MDTTTHSTEPRLDIGGNNPPTTELERVAELLETVSPWLASRPELADSAEAEAAHGFVDKLRALKKDVTAAQKTELEPHEAAAAAVKTKYRGPLASIESALKALLDKSGAWIQKERARVAAEKAAQEAEARRLREEAARLERESQEASDRAAADIEAAHEAARAAHLAKVAAKTAEKVADKPPEKVIIKGAPATRSVSLRAYWRAEVSDEAEALKSFQDHPAVRKAGLEVALRLANEQARTEKREDAAPAGFRFIKEERAY